ncbi:GntR family transcriptional regulator [Streptomyces sp. NPDC016566]|uniref:GntR family transcriptional regulator n=1 Tax=Streptomyces sp. NPDC016566 TaxID=3364967 RepID=UPI00370047BC
MGSSKDADAWMGDAQPYLAPRRAGERDAWSAEAAAHGRRGGQRLLAVEEVDPPADVRTFFRVGLGEKVVVRRRLILLDAEPVELADSYYPSHIARGTALAERGKIPGGAVTLLDSLGHTPAADSLEDVFASAATPYQCDALGLSAGAPVLVLTRYTSSVVGEPIEVTVMTMTRHLQYQRKQGV